MTISSRSKVAGTTVALAVMALTGCGGGGTTTTPAASGKTGGTATVAMGTAPDSLDPQFGYTTQAAEADWITYTPLLTYAHANGQPGTQLIPGLASDLPTVSPDGLTYTLQLRSGLTYSDGTPVKASDFTHAIERAIKINWGGASFFSNYIVGADTYLKNTAPTISGITTDDNSGKITIQLSTAYGAFANVLAFPAAALVPPNTPMTAESNNPPPGVGAYMITNVNPNVSFVMQKNPRFAAFKIPGIPAGSLDSIKVNIVSNTQSEAQQVLSNQVDNFDAGDTIPGALLSQIQSQASSRFTKEAVATSYYFFLNTSTAPFNNPAARQAVNMALDRTALARISSGSLSPGCYFLPPPIVGHPSAPCPAGDPSQVPSGATVAKAKAMIAQAGLAGTPVTVWSETRSPRQDYCVYFAGLLNQLGFKASLKVIQDSVYFQTVGNQATNPQTGFADWSQDFPNPSDFYLLLDGTAIQAQNNENFGQVNDPHIQSELKKLDAVSATKLSSVSSEWASLDQYTAQQAYTATMGYETVPKFFSTRIDYGSAVFNPVYYNDWSTWKLK